MLHWLSSQPAVHWLAPRPQLYMQNQVASMIVQSNVVEKGEDFKDDDAHPFWDADLNGDGEIIGIGDSGIDMESCFFKDPANPFVKPPAGVTEWRSPTHRKVVYYDGRVDPDFADLVGHGTHTCGTLAGLDPASSNVLATGAAKGARIAFIDLSRTSSGDVNAPQDLATDYFPRTAGAGAMVFSDSWGSSSPVYDVQSASVDEYLFTNQDALSCFAAGNYGENDNLDSTITSPATAKNVMTVGASKSISPNYVSQTIAPVFLMTASVFRKTRPVQHLNMRLVKAGALSSRRVGKMHLATKL